MRFRVYSDLSGCILYRIPQSESELRSRRAIILASGQ